MRQDVGEEGIEADIGLRRSGQHALGNWRQDAVEFGLLHVFQHHALRSLLLDHALVVRQVVSRGLHAVIAIARAENFVHHANG